MKAGSSTLREECSRRTKLYARVLDASGAEDAPWAAGPVRMLSKLLSIRLGETDWGLRFLVRSTVLKQSRSGIALGNWIGSEESMVPVGGENARG